MRVQYLAAESQETVDDLMEVHAAQQALRDAEEQETGKLHTSTLIHSAMKRRDIKLHRSRGPQDPRTFSVRIEVGYTFEDLLGSAYWQRYRDGDLVSFRDEPVDVMENVIVSPDDWEPGEAVYEYKATWYSMGPDNGLAQVTRRWDWSHQMRAGCLALGEDMSILKVLFINSDYPMKPVPDIGLYAYFWTPEEIQETNDLLVNERDYIKNAGGA